MTVGRRKNRRILQAAVTAAAMCVGAGAHAADATWNTNASGNWFDPSKWSTNPEIPGQLGTTTNADLVSIAPGVSGKTITLDSGRNLAGIEFDSNSGGVTLTGGSLVLTAGGTLQVTGAGGGAGASIASPITLAGDGTFTSSSSAVSRTFRISGTVTGSAGPEAMSVLTLNGTHAEITNAISGTISDGENGGALAIVKDGTGAWSLNVANSYTGGTTLRNGTLVILNGGALGSGTVTFENGIFRANSGFTVTNDVVLQGSVSYGSNNNFTFNGDFSLGDAAGTVRTIDVSGGNASTLTVSAAITSGATANTIRKTGGGTLTLRNNASTYTHLIVEGGTVNANTTVSGSGSTYDSPVSMGTAFGTGKITLNGGTIRNALSSGGPSGSDYNFGVVSNDIEVQSGGGAITHSGLARSIVLYSGQISGTGTLRFNNGTSGSQDPNGFALTQTNSFTGGIEINTTGNATSARAFVIADAVNALGGGATGTGGVVSFIHTSTTPLTAIPYLMLKANQTVAGLSGTRSRAFVTGYSPDTTVTLTINNTAGQVGDGSVYSGFIAAGTMSSIAGISGSMVSGNNLKLVKEGSGTQILTGLNAYSGGTEINGGTLVVNGGATAAVGPVIGTFSANSPIVNIDTTGLQVGQFVFGAPGSTAKQIVAIEEGSILLNSNVSTSAGSLEFSFSSLGSARAVEGITLASAAATGSTSITVSSTEGLTIGQFIGGTRISGGTQITAINGNVLSLSLPTSNSGGVTVGTVLQVSGTSGTGGGDVVVNAGRLAGVGGIAGAVTVHDGGTIAPGATAGSSLGTLSVGGLTLDAGAVYHAELDFAGPSSTGVSDRLAVTGEVAIDGATLALSLLNTDGLVNKTFVLLTNDGTDLINGVFSAVTPAGQIGYTISYDYNADGGEVGNDIAITFTSVPEPGAVSLLMAAGGLMLRRRRRAM